MSGGYFDGSGFFPAQPSSPEVVSSYGWNDDLVSLPRLTFDAGYSVGFTDAQMRAGISVEAGALAVDIEAMVAAGGGGANARGVMYLDVPEAQAPLYFEVAGQSQSPAASTRRSSACLGVAYFAPGASVPSNPPARLGQFAAGCLLALGAGGGQNGGNPVQTRSHWNWSANETTPTTVGGATSNFLGWATVNPLDLSVIAAQRADNISYPPASTVATIAGSRYAERDGLPLPAGHRLRFCLVVFTLSLTGTGEHCKLTFRKFTARWSP